MKRKRAIALAVLLAVAVGLFPHGKMSLWLSAVTFFGACVIFLAGERRSSKEWLFAALGISVVISAFWGGTVAFNNTIVPKPFPWAEVFRVGMIGTAILVAAMEIWLLIEEKMSPKRRQRVVARMRGNAFKEVQAERKVWAAQGKMPPR